MSTKYDELDKVHEQLIEEDGLKTSELPSNIKKKIKGWNLLEKRLQKNPDDKRLFVSIQKKSVEIADNIQDYIESKLEDDNDDGNGGGSSDDGGGSSDKDGKGSSDDGGGSSDKDGKGSSDDGGGSSDKDGKGSSDDGGGSSHKGGNSPKKSKSGFGNLVMEKKILAKMKENNSKRISESDLATIIGKSPDYPEQKVHNLNLRKAFFSSEYRLV